MACFPAVRSARWAWLLGLLAVTASLAATEGPGRIAVAGLYPMGYVGCLARHGLPRDLLYEDRKSVV